MSRRFSIFTKIIAVGVIVAVCVAMVPSKVLAGPCDYEGTAMLALAYGSCGATAVACVHAIVARNSWSAAGCAFGLFTCAGSIWAAVSAVRSYNNCLAGEGR